jgi:hypothetical protein
MNAFSPRRMLLTRDVTQEECHWLPRDYRAGETLWTFHGYTYGTVAHGMAMSEMPGANPFFEFPRDALAEREARAS